MAGHVELLFGGGVERQEYRSGPSLRKVSLEQRTERALGDPRLLWARTETVRGKQSWRRGRPASGWKEGASTPETRPRPGLRGAANDARVRAMLFNGPRRNWIAGSSFFDYGFEK